MGIKMTDHCLKVMESLRDLIHKGRIEVKIGCRTAHLFDTDAQLINSRVILFQEKDESQACYLYVGGILSDDNAKYHGEIVLSCKCNSNKQIKVTHLINKHNALNYKFWSNVLKGYGFEPVCD